MDIAKFKDWYPSPLNLVLNNTEESSLKSWLLIIGMTIIISSLVTVGYCTYSYYQEVLPYGVINRIGESINPSGWWSSIKNTTSNIYSSIFSSGPINNTGNNDLIAPADNIIASGARTPLGLGLQIQTNNTFMDRLFNTVRYNIIGNAPSVPHHIPGANHIPVEIIQPLEVLSTPSPLDEVIARASSPAEKLAEAVSHQWEQASE